MAATAKHTTRWTVKPAADGSSAAGSMNAPGPPPDR
jgi:hypothetical protein